MEKINPEEIVNKFPKIGGFRFTIFLITLGFALTYIIFCQINPKLIELSSFATTVVFTGMALITGKTVTDTTGKK